MKVLVTGVSGQLGHDVTNELIGRAHEAVGCGSSAEYKGVWDGSPVTTVEYHTGDITDSRSIMDLISEIKPDAVIHCAAWTNVDGAEDPENRDKVNAVNVTGTRNVAEACARFGCKMIYISTDYVFDGQGETPWKPEQQDFHPLNLYGESKLAGELAVRELLKNYFIVRISWAFGLSGNNFVKTMLRVGQNHDEVRVVSDQIGSPTYTKDLARLLVDMVESDRYGIYHATNEGEFISWYDFTCEIYRQAGYHTKVVPVSTAEYGLSKAARPINSRMDKGKLRKNGFRPLPEWKDALNRYLKELNGE